METPLVPLPALRLLLAVACPLGEPVTRTRPRIATGWAEWLWHQCGVCAACFADLPRRAGTWLHAATDQEARWWHWQVTERCGGLVHQYRDQRFLILRHDPSIRRDDLNADLTSPDAASPDDPYAGDW